MSKIVDLTGLSRFWSNVDKKKASIDGTYPDLTAGDLAGRGESVPAEFGFRASGGKSIKDGRAYIKRIKGNSVVWNNYFNIEKISVDGGTMSRDGNKIVVTATGEYPRIIGYTATLGTLPKGHVVLITFNADKQLKINFPSSAILGQGYANGYEWQLFVVNEYDYFTIYHDAESYTVGNIRITDLTKMFQAGNEPTTIEEFNARVATLGIEDMYAYNEGEVIHCNTESIKSVGDNAWDEQWESGHIDYNTGVNTPDSSRLRTKGYIRVLPNEEYHLSLPTASYPSDLVVICYDENKAFVQHIGGGSANKTFRIPTNCHYIRFTWDGTQYANNIMLSLVHSGWKQDTDAGYQPYWEDTLPLPIIRKYFPDGMKKAGSAHDEIRHNKASGKVEAVQRIGSADLESVADIKYNSEIGAFYFALTDMRSPTTYEERATGFICSRYNASNNVAVAGMPDKTMLRFPGGYIYIKDSAYTDAATFKASLQGVMLYYELAEPIVTEIAEDFRDYYNVADFGTEMSQSNVPSAAFSADIIYQFNAVDMIREHEAEINELQSIIATMQAQLTSLINK